MIKNCIAADCGKEFETEKETQVFCSGACVARDKRLKILAKQTKKPKRKAKKTIKKKPMEDKKEPVYGDMTEIFSEPDFSETEQPMKATEVVNAALVEAGILPESFEGSKENRFAMDEIGKTVSSKATIQTATSWIAAIEAYCEEQSITPMDLIEAHKGTAKPVKDKKPIHGLSYFEQRQKRQAFGE
jgi:hypothetical protein